MANTLFLKLLVYSTSLLIIVKSDGVNYSNRIAITSLIIMWISTLGIFYKDQQPYSLIKIFYLFSFFFFGLAPYIQFLSGAQFFGSPKLPEYLYYATNIVIIIILISYFFLYYYFYQQRVSSFYLNRIRNLDYDPYLLRTKKLIILFSISIFSFLLIFYYNNFNIISMLIRGGEEKEIVALSSSLSLVVTKFFQPMVMICFLYYISIKQKNILVLIALFILTLISVSPIGVPRFAAAALYIPVLLFIRFFNKKNHFTAFFVLGLLLIFPLLSNFRVYSTDQNFSLGFNFEMFNSGAFDSYQNFALILHHNIITYGQQLFGVLFFWIPRNVWPDKPIGSGAFIAEKLGFIFPNVSANFFAEGYINFGGFGIFLFTIIISYLTAKFDKLYWVFIYKKRQNFFKIIYFIFLGLLFFILRGDLLSSFAFSVGFLLSALFVFKLIKENINYKH